MPLPRLSSVTPILMVRDVTAATEFYRLKLGFAIDFLYGEPPFYGAVSRDGVCLHLRFVQEPNFAALASQEVWLVLATIEVDDIHALFAEFDARGVEFVQKPTTQDWGGTDFHVRDLDGNQISFVQYLVATGS